MIRLAEAAEAPHSLAAEIFRDVIVAAAEPFIMCDRDLCIVFANDAACRLVRAKSNSLAGRQLATLLPERHRAAHVAWMRSFLARGKAAGSSNTGRRTLSGLREDGSEFPASVTVTRICHDGDWYIATFIRNRTATRSALGALKRRASHDELTDLPNRRAFMEAAEQEIARCGRYGSSFALAIIDVDRFKEVNDSFGHPAGDAVLCAVAAGCRASIRSTDVAARLGGDEFALLLIAADEASAKTVCERLRETIASLRLAAGTGTPIATTVSIGAACWAEGMAVDDLLAEADRALYAAKASGRNGVSVLPAQDH